MPSQIELLQNGDTFQFAFANYITCSGDTLEGHGITPDVEIKHSRQSLLAGRDVVLEAALDWMNGKEKNQQSEATLGDLARRKIHIFIPACPGQEN